MSLKKRLTELLLGPAPLRNRPGGLAIVHGFNDADTRELNGCIVTTVRADSRGFWSIKPALSMVSRHKRESVSGAIAQPGDVVDIVSIGDDHLRPLKDPGAGERTEERFFQPPVPSKARVVA